MDICLTKTYLVCNIQLDDEKLEIPGCNLVRSVHQSNNKLEKVFLDYKDLLPLRVPDICLLQECICFEIMVSEKRCIFAVLYRLPGQNKDVFDSFSNNFELNLDKYEHNNPFLRPKRENESVCIP